MCFGFRKKVLARQAEIAARQEELMAKLSALEVATAANREAITTAMSLGNTALVDGIRATNEAVLDNVKQISSSTSQRINDIKLDLDKNLLGIKSDLDKNLTNIRDDNAKQLGEMRSVVDEKLTKTLNERIAQSFTTISERLDAVNKGLGEMQSLSNGVTDLRKVLSNVKTRGTWGEVSLENLLDNILTSGQYVKQYMLSGKKERVDFAVVLPGKDKDKVYLPIDVKFPIEDYQRLVDASDNGDVNGTQLAVKALDNAVKLQAKSICDKYICPPETVDFAVMYLPIEGLYAEIVRKSGFVEELQSNYHVVVAGPTTISALLNSLQQGFKTLAIQKSSHVVFDLLLKFRKDFALFLKDIDQAQKQVNSAGKSLEEATRRTNIIQKKLDKVDGIEPPEEDTLSLNNPPDLM